ncbi:efflux RND transporter permease subunit [Paenibacillus glycanilyticus]|uniref:Swarming motility protein SwrC n=1 Tax=Paenibacillus glycanilyticus TaxID=126569 RepID=A0ABQ6GI38_9BACL|nr:efflux RND transporter permease subunit [Paenibacillus glycanilyticus]GLX69775.1 swarming motility protein SwrC [Paenibacillus glycanilyticus]
MSGLTKISLKNGVAVVILCVLVLGYGLYASTQIKQQTFPDLEFPAVFVQVVDPGSSTEEIETEITSPLEDSLKSIKGYDSLTSTSMEDAANVIIQFPFGSDMEKRSAEVEAAVNKLQLPEKAEVNVQRMSINASASFEAAVFAKGKEAAALQQKLQDEIVPKIKQLAGVSSVELTGTSSETLGIVVDKNKAQERGITLSAIQSALEDNNYALPLGSVMKDNTMIPIRLNGQVTAREQLEHLRINPAQMGDGGNGTPVLLSEIATIAEETKQDQIARFNDDPSLILSVVNAQDANTADVSDLVKETLASYESQGIEFHIIQDQGEEIKESVSGLVREGLYGTLFCVLIIFLFLRNVRATIISIVSLPISIFATIAIMNQMGYTLNIMTLGGIAVSIGRIVDDSIVVIENIYRWKQEKGEELSGKELAYKATKEVISAVGSSTVAMVVVFAPLAFVSGILGEFFRPFSLAVVISILTSLLVAMMLIPVLGSKFFKQVKPHKEESRLANAFEKVVRGALKRKITVIALSIALLIGSLCLIPALGVGFLPAGSVPKASVSLSLPPTSSLESTDKLAGKVEAYLKSQTGIVRYDVTIGLGDNEFAATNDATRATINTEFAKGTDMLPLIDRMSTELQKIASADVPGTLVEVKAAEGDGPPSGDTIDVSLYAQDPVKLAQAAKQIEDLMKAKTDIKSVSNNMNETTPKWVLTLNQKGIDAGVSPMAIMQLAGEQLRPIDAGTYTIDNKTQAVMLSYGQQITSEAELANVQIPTDRGMMPLGTFADIEEQNAWIQVNHDNGKMYAKVSGKTKNPDDVSAVTKQVQKDMDSLTLPEGVVVKTGGGMDMITDGFISLGIAMAVAVGLVFLVMSMTFSGLITPLIIMCSLIFIPVGSLGGLLITGQALTMSSMIGMLMLVGIVVTNAIVLLDRVEKNRKSGMELREAIVEASKTRLRPILMTAFATMLALLPLALSGSTTNLISGGLAITVIGGLFTSTLLTLVVMPVIYELAWRKRKVKPEETF